MLPIQFERPCVVRAAEELTDVAIAIGHQGDTTRSLVPCKKCGALFALTIEKKEVKLFNPVSGKTEAVVGLGLESPGIRE